MDLPSGQRALAAPGEGAWFAPFGRSRVVSWLTRLSMETVPALAPIFVALRAPHLKSAMWVTQFC